MIRIDLQVEPKQFDCRSYFPEHPEERPFTSDETTEKPPWYEDEICQLARIHSISQNDARKLLRRLVMGCKAVHICTWDEAYMIYNHERCHRCDREFFIETVMRDEGKTYEQAVSMADSCVLYF